MSSNVLQKPLFGYSLLRRWLFKKEAERAHEWALGLMHFAFALPPIVWLLQSLWGKRYAHLQRRCMGLDFPTPVGLAAGFDKNARLIRGLHSLGFGFCETGTVTLRPQPGNPQPRLWRDPEHGALINSLGFNNEGGEAMVRRLRRWQHRPIPVGVNIGKNKETTLEAAPAEYVTLLELVYPHADYIVVNVSSPNTPGLRDLQQPEYLRPLLTELSEHGKRLAVLHGLTRRPLLVKLAPELDDAALKQVAQLVQECDVQGVVAANTIKTERGGRSGTPLLPGTLQMVRRLRELLGPELVIIGVGGIDSPAAALEVLRAGADLVQLYTALVYRGPMLVSHINHSLARTIRDSRMPGLGDYLNGVREVRT